MGGFIETHAKAKEGLNEVPWRSLVSRWCVAVESQFALAGESCCLPAVRRRLVKLLGRMVRMETDEVASKKDAGKVEAEEEEEEGASKVQDRMLVLAERLYLGEGEAVAAACVEEKRGGYYRHVCEVSGLSPDAAAVAAMESHCESEVATLDAALKDAEENLGETEVREALLKKAMFWAGWGDKAKAVEAYRACEAKTSPLGQKFDLVFDLMRVGLLWKDFELVKGELDKARRYVDEGGDWERKNRLRVYEAVFAMERRELKEANKLLLESVATFATYELFGYERFVFYCVVTAMVSLERVQLKKKVVQSPEVLSVIGKNPSLKSMVNALYDCEYGKFNAALVDVSDAVKADRYLGTHLRYYLREVRVVAYTQFLESYRSVQTRSMADAFGVSVEFLDREISRFIAAGRLNCKIDRMGGIIESVRPDEKNALYAQTIKQGDQLLNRVQKLTHIVSV